MLELGQLVDARPGQLRQAGGVEFPARYGQHRLAGVDQRGQHHDDPFGFEAKALRRKVFHAADIPDQLGAVDHLPEALLSDDIEDVSGVFGAVRVEPVAVEEFECVERRDALFRAGVSGDGAKGVLRGLRPVPSGDEHRKNRVFGRLILETGCEADTRDGVHQVSEADALVGADAREFADGLALGPLDERLAAPLARDVEGRRHVPLEPLHEVAQKVRRLGFVGRLGVPRSGR